MEISHDKCVELNWQKSALIKSKVYTAWDSLIDALFEHSGCLENKYSDNRLTPKIARTDSFLDYFEHTTHCVKMPWKGAEKNVVCVKCNLINAECHARFLSPSNHF